ncbi:NAD(P)-binding protein [Punctularia strigosozonata HHB-11173 SS5]|uniref:NAD(P)-binding protein n=1 Tax=Punctularia strigosozonata (strain HHB-11173) TaxID=741275 RepID=R7S546_PUNST|nr:NAD(P)-binding protein [Punctularia strigosozonata HHB-11173 SS5]EIN04982.1 NAD(P)-binding protein [Punctularia strigosozonata HHB-11173 SS5]
MAPVVYLVSGANRGIGLGIVAALVARDDVAVFAGVRDLSSADALKDLGAQHPGKLHVVQLVSADKPNNERAISEIKDKHRGSHIISSIAGSIARGTEVPLGFLPYGMSNAAVNYLSKRLHVEYASDGLVSFSIAPGPVMTDLFTGAGALIDSKSVSPDVLSADEVGRRIAKLVEEAKRDDAGGQFLDHSGKKCQW